jgi:RNA ligase (TIGR02306 family)
MRQLVTIRTVDELRPIEGADMIELAIVNGWQCVVKKGEFKLGDKGIYFEIDSFLPTDNPLFAFLAPKKRVFNGVEGHRLRTIRLRKQLSQGLLLPCLKELPQGDLAEHFGVQLYEKPLPAQLGGTVRGTLPSFFPKTDQERIQNLDVSRREDLFEVTLKMDGSSMSVYRMDEDYGVCSRNLSLRETEGNTFWAVARRRALLEILAADGRNLALQGELCGPGIQSNPHKLGDHQFFLFDVYLIDEKRYMTPTERILFAAKHHVQHAPVIERAFKLLPRPELMAMADATKLEGIVLKSETEAFSFKVISNDYLLKEKD